MSVIDWQPHDPNYDPHRYSGYSGKSKIFQIAPSVGVKGDYHVTAYLPGYKMDFQKTGTVEEVNYPPLTQGACERLNETKQLD